MDPTAPPPRSETTESHDRSNATSSVHELIGCLRRLANLCPDGRPAAENLDATIRDLVAKILEGGYRADLVFGVLSHWSDDTPHFPSWHGLKLALDAKAPSRSTAPPIPPEYRLLPPGRIPRVEDYAATVMRSDLGQMALAEGWGRFLWAFAMDKRRPPVAQEVTVLRYERDEFLAALDKCSDPEAWPEHTPTKIGTWRPLGMACTQLLSLGNTMLAREARLRDAYVTQ